MGGLEVKWKLGVGMKEVLLWIENYSQRCRLLVKGIRMTQGESVSDQIW